MNELNKLFDEILSEKTAPGELFETKLVTNEKGVTFTEYANFPDSIRNFFDFGLKTLKSHSQHHIRIR